MTSRAPRRSWTRLPELDPAPATVLDWLEGRFPRVGRERWQRRLDSKLIEDEHGQPLRADAPFTAGQRLAYYRELDDEPDDEQPIPILAVDDHLVVADKPPFLPVVPSGRFVRRCLLYRVEEQLALSGLSPVHRLDRATSGLVLLARRPDEVGAYGGLFARRQVERRYEALAAIAAPPTETHWRRASRIVPGEPFFRMAEAAGPPNATTDIALLDHGGGIGRFVLRPATGKKHQLRIHMAALGFPILGDRLYPELLPEVPDDESRPLALVARELRFVDPVTGEQRGFESGFSLCGKGDRPTVR